MFPSEEFRLLDPELQWYGIAPKPKEPVRGWITGPLVLVSVHFNGEADKPCRSKITGGALKCRCEDEPMSVRQKGYIPLRTREGRKLVIIMCATTAKRVQQLAKGTPVEFWRPPVAKTPLAFKVLLPDELGTTETGKWARCSPDDVRPYLVHVLWQDAAVARYFPRCQSSSVPALTQAPAPTNTYPPLVRRKPARDNTVSLPKLTEGIGTPPDAA